MTNSTSKQVISLRAGIRCVQAVSFPAVAQVASAVEPDLVIFVMDSSIGQAAQEQAQAFRESVQARESRANAA